MSEGSKRLPWEFADGPVVGRDVPITSEPRDEDSDQPVEKRSQRREGLEEREVKADDPELSSETNQRLTEELREVVGAERVRVPVDRPKVSEGDRSWRTGAGAALNSRRLQVVRSTAIVLTFGAIVSLATGDWWLLPLAAGVHALGTVTVLLTTFRMTTIVEHASPQLSAAMAEEGIRTPDERFSELVEEFSPEPQHGVGEVLAPGNADRTAPAGEETPLAASQQSSAPTPTSGESRPSGEGGLPELMPWTTWASLFVLTIVLSAVEGGWMWLLTAVMIPLLVAWAVIDRFSIVHPGETGRIIRDRRALIVLVCLTGAAVAGFCAVVALAFHH